MLKESIERFKKPTPKFFRKLGKFLVSIGGIGTGILVVIPTLPISLPAILVTLAGYMVVGGIVGAGVTQLAVENPKELEHGNDN